MTPPPPSWHLAAPSNKITAELEGKIKTKIENWGAMFYSALTLLVQRQEEHPAWRTQWWYAGMVIGLERGANDLHMVQLIPLSPHHLCSNKIQKIYFSGASLPRLFWKKVVHGCCCCDIMTNLDNCSWLMVPYVYSRTIGEHQYSWICLGIIISIDACDGSTVAAVSIDRLPATTQWVSTHNSKPWTTQ